MPAKRRIDIQSESSPGEDVKPAMKRQTIATARSNKKEHNYLESSDEEVEEQEKKPVSVSKGKSKFTPKKVKREAVVCDLNHFQAHTDLTSPWIKMMEVSRTTRETS